MNDIIKVGDTVEVIVNNVHAENGKGEELKPGDQVVVTKIEDHCVYYCVKINIMNYLPIKCVKKIIKNQVEIRFRK
jgi:hypothetical protein